MATMSETARIDPSSNIATSSDYNACGEVLLLLTAETSPWSLVVASVDQIAKSQGIFH